MNLNELHPKIFFLKTWAGIDEKARRYRQQNPDRQTKDAIKIFYIFFIAMASLILQEYLGNRSCFLKIVYFVDDPQSPANSPFLFFLVSFLKPQNSTLMSYFFQGGYFELWVLGYWALWRVFGFLGFALAAVYLHPAMRVKDLGFSVRGIKQHLWIYAVLLVPVLAVVVAVSFIDEFSSYYPFYDNSHRTIHEFIIWELFYMAQFLALEVFFRGFLLLPLSKHMGSTAIFAMMIPYVMIHFGKPMLECFGAIIAGIVLGTLALKTKSIWLGFFVHVTVAVAMDIMAIIQRNY